MPSRQPEPAPEGLPQVVVVHAKHLPITALLAAGLLIILALLLTVVAVVLYRRLAQRRTAPLSTDPKPTPEATGTPRRFPYDQLRRATSSFSPANKLGQGGFGSVFRGTLPSGQEIAVKLMDSGSLQGEREFRNEIALATTMGKAASALESAPEHVVSPLGFCSEEDEGGGQRSKRRKKKKKRRKKDEVDDFDDDSFGDGGGRGGGGRLLILVYDLMHNGSLQDALLHRKCPELMEWARRFRLALEIARGLLFLHSACDPPIVHGDIKPSNILLDSQFSAKISDFGLARILTNSAAAAVDDAAAASGVTPAKVEEDGVVIDVADERLAGSRLGKIKNGNASPDPINGFGGGGGEENGSTTAAEEEAFARVPEEEGVSPDTSAVNLEVASTSETGGFDKLSVDSRTDMLESGSRVGWKKKSVSVSGKDWWWRQDGGGGGGGGGGEGKSEPGTKVKDYVMEWLGSEIRKERPTKRDSIIPTASTSTVLPPTGKTDRKKQQKRLEWWPSLDEERLRRKEKSRPAREWWREEFCDELANKKRKKKKRAMAKCDSINGQGGEPKWWQKDEEYTSPPERKCRKKRSWSRSSRTSMDWWMDGLSGDFRFTGRRSSLDGASGDIPKSGGISSTPSMRGTVCYVAPEYGGGGPLSEKCDIYSFGVLMLVLISGRRPLQVTASPMSEFERANLISWARHLAHAGKLLDLVDSSVQDVDREQALLCITVALLCLQRSPARRPSIKEVVGMLSGDSEPPQLPLEFSPSPPGGFSFKSRRKAR